VTEPAESFCANGTELAGYVIRSLIGRGSTSSVYVAEDRSLGRMVALKVLAPDLANSENFRRRFLRESQVAASLDHPNIVPIYDAGETHGTLYIAMRYVEGSNLRARLARGRLIDISYLLDVLCQVADALDAAHSHDLVHGDLKPANILISSATADTGHDHIYVTDFGVTRPLTAVDGADSAESVGTAHYLAPEQILGETVTPRTDVYALGCIVYHCLTGTPPLAGRDDAAVMTVPVVDAPPPVSQQRPDLPAAVDHVLATAMGTGPADRYPDCGTFITALREQLHRSGSVARDRRTVSPAPRRREAASDWAPGRIRRRTVLGMITGVGVVAAGIVVYNATSAQRFEATDRIPISLSYPAHWLEAHGGTTVALSPYAQLMLSLFGGNGGVQNWWPRIGEILRTDPVHMLGVVIEARDDEGAQSPKSQEQELQAYLPRDSEPVGEPVPRVLDGVQANLHEAILRQPTAAAAQLHLQCYIATIGAPKRTVWLIFVSAGNRSGYDRSTFDGIAKSVDFPG
jgi:hypothetical protein